MFEGNGIIQELYRDIAARPIALDLDCDVVTFFSPVKAVSTARLCLDTCSAMMIGIILCLPLQGWLLKRCSGTVTRWKRRYFLLADSCLYYFASEVRSGCAPFVM
jgi:hypothetical protein